MIKFPKFSRVFKTKSPFYKNRLQTKAMNDLRLIIESYSQRSLELSVKYSRCYRGAAKLAEYSYSKSLSPQQIVFSVTFHSLIIVAI